IRYVSVRTPYVCMSISFALLGSDDQRHPHSFPTRRSSDLLYPNLWLAMLVGTAAVAYTAYLLYVGLPTFMGIHPDEGFLFASSVLAVGLVVLVAMLAASVVIWGMGIGPVYTL